MMLIANISDIDYAVEQESTADGFSVYTFKHPDEEDLYK